MSQKIELSYPQNFVVSSEIDEDAVLAEVANIGRHLGQMEATRAAVYLQINNQVEKLKEKVGNFKIFEKLILIIP